MSKAVKKRLIVVLGMHRSGTSAVARSLQVFQVALGNRLMPGVADINPTGFWEDLDIYALNVEILNAVEGDWQSLSRIKARDVAKLRKAGFFDRAVALLHAKVRAGPIFGFKDPRTAKLLPFWRPVFARCKLEVKYLIVVRHPLSVVRSLSRRDKFLPEKSYLLWLEYVLESLTGTDGCERMIVDYDRLMENPEREINRMAATLGLEISVDELAVFKNEFLDKGLRHTVFSSVDLKNDTACLPLVADIYPELFEVATDSISLSSQRFKKNLAAWEHEFARHEGILAGYVGNSDLAGKLDTEKTALVESIAIRDVQINALAERLNFLEAESRKSACESAFYCTVEYNQSVFSETSKLRQVLDLSGKFEILEFDLPACAMPYSRLRWDPADCPCAIDLQSFELLSLSGDIAWKAETPANCFSALNEQLLVMLSPNSLASILCFGGDPNLQLVLPQNVLDQLSKEGGKLRLKLRGRRIDNTAVFAAHDFRVMLRSDLEPPHWAGSMTNVLSTKLDHGNGHLAQLSLGLNDSAAREQHFLEKISALATQTESLRASLIDGQARAEQEQAHFQKQLASVHLQFAQDAAELLQAQTRATDLQSTLTAREREFGETLLASQQESLALVQSLTEQLEGSRQNALRLSALLESVQQALAHREREFSDQLQLHQQVSQSNIESLTEQLRESQSTLTAREREFSKQLQFNQQVSHSNIESLTEQLRESQSTLTAREREFSEQLLLSQQDAQSRVLSVTEQLQKSQMTLLAREREFGERLQSSQQTSLALIQSLTMQLEGSRREALRLAQFISANEAKSAAQMLSTQTALSELHLTIAACERAVDLETSHIRAEIAQLNQTMRSLEEDIATKSRELISIKSSAAWKATAPLRWIGRVGP